MTDFAALVSELEEATLAFGIHQGRSPMDDQLQRRIRCRAARDALHAALSAQSTGSAGVAAEPVAWTYEWMTDNGVWRQAYCPDDPGLKQSADVRNIRPLYEHPPVAAEERGDHFEGALLATKEAADDLARACVDEGDDKGAGALQFISGLISDLLAVAPAPPAGGGETSKPAPRKVIEGKTWTGAPCPVLAPAEPTPASPAGDLNSLSAGATPDKVANAVMQLDWAKPSKALLWRDYEDTVEQRFRDVEAAVAALAPADRGEPDQGGEAR